jgi:hypothetical protein
MQKIERSALPQQTQIAGGCKGGSSTNNSSTSNSVVVIHLS